MGKAPGAGALQTGVRTITRPIANRLWDLDLTGFEKLPASGPAILCPNHISFIDSTFLMLSVPRNISFVGKAEYMDSWKTRYVFPALGMIPIDRSGGNKSNAALQLAEQVLRGGGLFGIYPEGTRSRDGRLHKGRTGAARLALTVDCPIFPVGIDGTDEIQPPDAPMPKVRKRARIQIGDPVFPARYRGRSAAHLAARSMIDEVMFEIREMTGREYVHSYAGEEAETEPTVAARVAHVDEPESRTDAEADLADRALAAVGGS